MAREQDCTYAPLLPKKEGDAESLGEYKSPPGESESLPGRNRKRSRLKTFVIVVQGITNVVLVLLLLQVLTRDKSMTPAVYEEQLLYSPVNHLIERQVIVYNNALRGDTSPYMGPPSPELDKAWDDLYQHGISRINRHDAKLLPWKTARIPSDPDHHIIELDVFHQLHCLNALRKELYPDYYPSYYPGGKEEREEHLNHCIEHLRQGITCAADVNPLVWQWSPAKNKTLGITGVPHSCRNFEKISDWARMEENRLHYDQWDPTIHVDDD